LNNIKTSLNYRAHLGLRIMTSSQAWRN